MLLNSDGTPGIIKPARPVGEIIEFLGSFRRDVVVLPDPDVAYANQVLVAEWRNNRWEVDHPCN